MNDKKKNQPPKGGRPKKAVKCDQKITVMCTLIERTVINAKARLALLTVSEYVRKMALGGKIDSRRKTLPKEILDLKGTLNHLAANLNQIAKKRNGIDELTLQERFALKLLSEQVRELAVDIKNYLK